MNDGGHWYTTDGEPCHWREKKDKSGNRPTTLRDARELNLLPSVTTILRVLHKEALVDWLIEQACLAVLTAPRNPGETIDDFVTRVLKTERQQDQESQIARDRGTAIHDAMESLFVTGKAMVITPHGSSENAEILPWVMPAFDAVQKYGRMICCEKVVVGSGYAGRTDLILDNHDCQWLIDWKSAKRLPTKGAWLEHRLQAAAYAESWHALQSRLKAASEAGTVVQPVKHIRTANAYISTVDQGKFVICEHGPWEPAYAEGFAPLVRYWQFSTGYCPNQSV